MSEQSALLLVDANREITALVSQVLKGPKWSVEHVPNNAAALALIERKRFDVVLSSEKTSAEEDVDLLRKIRRVHQHTRVIILTTPGTPEGVIAAIRENAFSYFAAPVDPEELRGMLELALEAPAWDDGIELRSANRRWIRILARCDRDTADRLVHFVYEIATDLTPADKMDLSTAFREMLLNAMEHGGHFSSDEYVEISYLRSSRAVSCRVRDPGRGFSLQEVPHAAVSNPPDSPCAHVQHRETEGLRPGGFGILLAQKLVDELIYNEKGNEVILIKHLPEAQAQTPG